MNGEGRTFSSRDYRKSVYLCLHGKEGKQAFAKILTSPRTKYDAKAAAEQAAENLRRQEMNI